MTIDNDPKAVVKAQVQSGMTAVNVASLPCRAVNVAIGGIVQLTTSNHPAAKKAIEKIGQTLHDCYQSSTLGKTWEATKVTIIDDFQKFNIPKEETAYFLDSVEELVVAGGTAGIGLLVKSILKTTKHFRAQIKEKNLSNLKDIHFGPKISGKTTHWFATGTPAEGLIRYRYARGTDKSVLIYLDFIKKKGRVLAAKTNPSRTKGLTPYCTLQAGINAIQEIGKKLGAKRIFLQYEPAVPKISAYIEKHYPHRGDYYPFKLHHFEDTYPVFEITPVPVIGTTQKVITVTTPLVAAETVRALPRNKHNESKHSSDPDEFPYSGVDEPSPSRLTIEQIREIFREPDGDIREPRQVSVDEIQEDLIADPVSEAEPESDLSNSEDSFSDLGQQILQFAGEVSGVKPAYEELVRVNEIVQCLAENPQEAPAKIVANILRRPVEHVQNIIDKPEAFLQNAERFLEDPAANYMGGIAAVAAIMTWMDSVSWVCEFARKPGRGTKELVKMPYTCVKGVVDLGVSLIKHPERTTKQFFKSVVKMPEHTVKRFFHAVGLKKKKKKHRHEEAPPPPMDPAVLQRLVDKYVQELPALYSLAKVKGFIEPFKTMEEYHHDLLADWQCGALNFPNGFFDFPQFLVAKMQANSLVYLRSYSPRAHPDRPILFPEVLVAFDVLDETLERVDATFKELDVVHQKHEEVAEQLTVAQEEFSRATEDLGATLALNREKIKRALINKRNKG